MVELNTVTSLADIAGRIRFQIVFSSHREIVLKPEIFSAMVCILRRPGAMLCLSSSTQTQDILTMDSRLKLK